MAAEPDPVAAFDLLLRWQVPGLFVAGYRRVPGARGFFRAAVRFSEVAARAGLDVDRGDVAAVALLAGQPAPVVSRALDRLAFRGEPRRMLAEAVTGDAPARLAGARTASAAADVLRPLSAPELAGAFVRGGARERRRIEWFLDEGRRLRPRLSGADLLAAGVPAGPAVGASLAELRRLRLDGRVKTVDGEWRRVKQWLRTSDPGGRPGAKGGLR